VYKQHTYIHSYMLCVYIYCRVARAHTTANIPCRGVQRSNLAARQHCHETARMLRLSLRLRLITNKYVCGHMLKLQAENSYIPQRVSRRGACCVVALNIACSRCEWNGNNSVARVAVAETTNISVCERQHSK